MDTMQITGWVLALLGVGAAIYFKVSGKPYDAFYDELHNKQTVARAAVTAVQQLWESGQIPEAQDGSKHALFLKAAEYVRAYYPDLTDAQLEMTVEAAVYWLKQASKSVAGE